MLRCSVQPAGRLLVNATRPTFRTFSAGNRAQSGLHFTSKALREGSHNKNQITRVVTRSLGSSKRAVSNLSVSANPLNYVAGGLAGLGLAALASYGYSRADSNPATYVAHLYVCLYAHLIAGNTFARASATLTCTWLALWV
jgi:hypothetical protein